VASRLADTTIHGAICPLAGRPAARHYPRGRNILRNFLSASVRAMPVPVLSPDLVELVGGIAAVLTTLSFLPQVLKAWRSRSARDVSLLMLLLFLAGVLLWLCYGLALGSLPLILANAVTAVLILAILAAKLRFRTPGAV